MADYLEKFNLANGVVQAVQAPRGCVAFDFTNDSPFDLDVQWGANQPVTMVIPPTTLWRGAKPASQLLVSGNQWDGRIIVTPVYPGGGSPPSGAPAMQLTVAGHLKGNEPQEQVLSLNRLQNVGNNVGTTIQQLVNDGNVAPTQVIEATPAAAGSSQLLFNNDGSGLLGGGKISINAAGLMSISQDDGGSSVEVLDFKDIHAGGHHWGIFLLSGGDLAIFDFDATYTALHLGSGGQNLDNGNITTDGTGGIRAGQYKYQVSTGGTVVVFDISLIGISPADWQLQAIGAPSGNFQRYALQMFNATLGARGWAINPDGGFMLSNAVPKKAWSRFTGTGTGTFNHGLGATPNHVTPVSHVVGSQTQGYDSENATTVHVTCGAGQAFTAEAMLF